MAEQYARILRLRQVVGRVGLSRSQIYALMQIGRFPKSISLGARAVGWLEAEVEAWINDRALKREWGNNIATNPQEPSSAINPTFRKTEKTKHSSIRSTTSKLVTSEATAGDHKLRMVAKS